MNSMKLINIKPNLFFCRTQLDSHESNIDLLEHRLEKVNITNLHYIK